MLIQLFLLCIITSASECWVHFKNETERHHVDLSNKIIDQNHRFTSDIFSKGDYYIRSFLSLKNSVDFRALQNGTGQCLFKDVNCQSVCGDKDFVRFDEPWRFELSSNSSMTFPQGSAITIVKFNWDCAISYTKDRTELIILVCLAGLFVLLLIAGIVRSTWKWYRRKIEEDDFLIRHHMKE